MSEKIKSLKQRFLSGELEVELTPQGTLAERFELAVLVFRAFTLLELPSLTEKKLKNLRGNLICLNTELWGILRLRKLGKQILSATLVYRKTSRNFNPLAAMAGKITIAEVEEIVKAGELDPETG